MPPIRSSGRRAGRNRTPARAWHVRPVSCVRPRPPVAPVRETPHNAIAASAVPRPEHHDDRRRYAFPQTRWLRRRAKKGGFGPGDLTEAEWRILKDMTPIERKNRNQDSLSNRTCQSSTAYPDDSGAVPHGTTCDRIRARYQFATIHLSTVNREARLPLCHPSSTQTPPTTRRPYARSLPDHRGESDHRAVCPPMPGRRRSTSHYGG